MLFLFSLPCHLHHHPYHHPYALIQLAQRKIRDILTQVKQQQNKPHQQMPEMGVAQQDATRRK